MKFLLIIPKYEWAVLIFSLQCCTKFNSLSNITPGSLMCSSLFNCVFCTEYRYNFYLCFVQRRLFYTRFAPLRGTLNRFICMKTERMQFYDRYKRSINRKIWKIKAHTFRVPSRVTSFSQPVIAAQVLLGLLAKRSLLFFGSQCLRAKRRHATRSCLAKRTG